MRAIGAAEQVQTAKERDALRARVAELEAEVAAAWAATGQTGTRGALRPLHEAVADLRAQLAAAQAEAERMEIRLIGAGAARADLAEAARHLDRVLPPEGKPECTEGCIRQRDRTPYDEQPCCSCGWEEIRFYADAARAWLKSRGGRR